MSAISIESELLLANPLDLLEEIVSANEWTFERPSDDEIVACIGGRWCDYQLHFAWCDDVSALQFSCSVDLRVPNEKRRVVGELIGLINAKMWIGHFDLVFEDACPAFRQTMLTRGAGGLSVEQFEDLLDAAITECERFYPAFQFVIWGGKSAGEAIEAALLETVGEA